MTARFAVELKEFAAWLPTVEWPSSRRGAFGELIGQPVAELTPQHAAACLAKLLRWALERPSGVLAGIDDITAREELVRASPLGRALSARAISLTDDNDVRALYYNLYQE